MPLFLRELVPEKTCFLTTLDVCCQKARGHKAVKFGRNTYLHWDYNVTKESFNSEGVGLGMSLFCVDLMWNDPFVENELQFNILNEILHMI
jgi:hypothetical protein